MYQNLGIHWASSIPAFLAAACVPFPLLFYIYGPRIRRHCKYAAESDMFMQKIIQQTLHGREDESKTQLPENRSGQEESTDLEQGIKEADTNTTAEAESGDQEKEMAAALS